MAAASTAEESRPEENEPILRGPYETEAPPPYQAYPSPSNKPESQNSSPGGIARRSLGIILLLLVVVLWTASNFLASTIFADNSYSKPFFVTYFNTAFFMLPLIPHGARALYKNWKERKPGSSGLPSINVIRPSSDTTADERNPFLGAQGEESAERGESGPLGGPSSKEEVAGKLDIRATAKLSFQFCLLWFFANYFAFGCLQYTTVGSTTILTSTSGVWTLIVGAMFGVEKFTSRKLLGVIASLTGIFIISRVDLSGSNDDHRGSFPHKTPGEIAIGDAMAGFSAVLYGVYTIVMKKQVGDESKVNMPLFFGLVGFFNTIMLWPCLILLHFTGVETFGLPETNRIWTIVLFNAMVSLVSDICWAYAMLLTTPLVVTVGLSMTIPLSLIAQIFIHGQYSSVLYWVGAAIVFFSFLVVNQESKREEAQ